MLPVIALVGRPNVGKSTLFNRLTRTRDALVADQPGLTRDRKYGVGQLGSRPYVVVDTGGISGDRAGVDVLMEQVKRGGKLSDVMRTCAYIPPFVRQLLSAGEESAEMSRMCRIISTHYAREAKHLAKQAATIVEPILIAGLTVIVLVVALAIFIPMWDMVSLV